MFQVPVEIPLHPVRLRDSKRDFGGLARLHPRLRLVPWTRMPQSASSIAAKWILQPHDPRIPHGPSTKRTLALMVSKLPTINLMVVSLNLKLGSWYGQKSALSIYQFQMTGEAGLRETQQPLFIDTGL